MLDVDLTRDVNRKGNEGDQGLGRPEEPLKTREGASRLTLPLQPGHVDKQPQTRCSKTLKKLKTYVFVSLVLARQEGACRVLGAPECVSGVQLSHSSRSATFMIMEACRSVDFYTLLRMAFKESPLPRFEVAFHIPFLEPRETKSLFPAQSSYQPEPD